MNRAQRLLGIFAVFGVGAAIAYWIYLYISEGEAPSFSDLWQGTKGGFTSVTGIGKLSFDELKALASNAGFPDDFSDTAAAIALAESSGNPNAVGDLNITPGGSIGLWQINLKAHPEYTADELTDPQANANAAYKIFQAAGGSFSPWTTYKTGAYQAYLQSSDNSENASLTSDDSISYDPEGEDQNG